MAIANLCVLCVYSVERSPGACYEDWRLNRRPSEGEEQELAVGFTGKYSFRKLGKIYLLLKDKIKKDIYFSSINNMQ